MIEHYKKQATSAPLAKQPTLVYSTLAGWSLKYHWVARVDAWTAIEQEREEIEWAERRRQIRQDDWVHARRLRDLAEKILDASPVFIKRTVRTEQGLPDAKGNRIDTRIVTVALDGNLLTKLEKVASDLGRLSAEIAPPVQRHDLRGKDGEELLPVDRVIAAMLAERKAKREQQSTDE